MSSHVCFERVGDTVLARIAQDDGTAYSLVFTCDQACEFGAKLLAVAVGAAADQLDLLDTPGGAV